MLDSETSCNKCGWYCQKKEKNDWCNFWNQKVDIEIIFDIHKYNCIHWFDRVLTKSW